MDSANAPGPCGNVPSGKMLSYEVHFFRADGTLSLRLHTAALGQEEVMRAMAKMQTGEFVEVKIWRGLDRAVVRHKPALPLSDSDSVTPV
jgi:hypothetical protein